MPATGFLGPIVATFLMIGGPMDPQPSVEDLAWMTGDRVQRSEKAEVREVWIGPGNGVLLGMSLTRRFDGRRGEWEHMRIDTLPDGTIAFIAMPSGQPEAVFRLKDYDGRTRRLTFENPEHDFPQRVISWDKGNGVIGAKIEGRTGGRPRSAEWTYTPRS